MKRTNFIIFSVFVVFFVSGCKKNERGITLDDSREYTTGFSKRMLRDSSFVEWKSVSEMPGYNILYRKPGIPKILTYRNELPDTLLRLKKLYKWFGFRSGIGRDVREFYLNEHFLGKRGEKNPYEPGADLELIEKFPGSFLKDNGKNYLYTVFHYGEKFQPPGQLTSPVIGPYKSIVNNYNFNCLINIILITVGFFLGFFILIIGIFRIKEPENIYFAVFCLSFSLFLVTNTIIKDIFYPGKNELRLILDYCSLLVSSSSLTLFVPQLLKGHTKYLPVRIFVIYCALIAPIIFFGSYTLTHYARVVFYLLTFLMVPWLIFMVIRELLRKNLDAVFLSTGIIAFMACGIHDILSFNNIIAFHFTLPYAFIFFIIEMTVLLSHRFIDTKNRLEELAGQLEKKVSTRTESLEKTLREKDKLLGIVGHDLKNSIGSIKSVVDFYSSGKNDPEEDKNSEEAEYIHLISMACKSSMDTIENMLREGAENPPEKKLIFEKVDLVEFIKPVLELYKMRALEKSIVLKAETPLGPVYLRVNRRMFSRVIDNLLSNAVKFTKDNGDVFLRVAVSAGCVVITVKDTGIGIPEHIKNDIYNEFTKAGRRGTRDEKSTGLGLSIVKRAVEIHKGTIDFTSSEGRGTIFRVEIPFEKN